MDPWMKLVRQKRSKHTLRSKKRGGGRGDITLVAITPPPVDCSQGKLKCPLRSFGDKVVRQLAFHVFDCEFDS